MQVAKLIWKSDAVISLMGHLNRDDAGSKGVGIFHSNDSGSYSTTTEELSKLIRAEGSLVKFPAKSAFLHATTLYDTHLSTKLMRDVHSP